MPKDRIKVIGPWLAWGDHVRRGQMIRPDGDAVPVLLRSHPEASDAAQLRKDGRLLTVLEHPHVLHLLHVTKSSGHPLWVYEGFEAVSLERVLQVLGSQGEYLPIRTCLELVGAVAEGMEAGLSVTLSGDGLTGPTPEVFHPGAAPSEVLVDGEGAVKVAGFRVRREGGAVELGLAGYRSPTQGSAEASAVYGLGALLVHLLSGEAPAAGSSEPERHRSIIRRALIRVLSRPGEAVSDPVIDLIRDSMAVDSAQRPSAAQLQSRIVERASEAGDADLSDWAPVKISPILQQQEEGYPSEEETRKRRYVDATSMHSDEPSRETPPVRRPPREVPTILAKPGEGLSLAVGKAGRGAGNHLTVETEPARVARDVMPSMDHSISLPLPDSLLSGQGVQGVDIDPSGKSLAGSVPMDIRSDEWNPLDSPTQARRASGWIMVGGVLAGMVVASLVAWVAMDRLAVPSSGAGDPGAREGQVEAMHAGEAADAMADAVPSTDELDAQEDPEAEPEGTEVPPEVPVVTDAPTPAAAPPPNEASKVVPPPAPPREAERVRKPAPTPPSRNGRFSVTFRSADPAVTRLEVRCHIGGGSGATKVRIAQAGPGPCKVIGHRAGQSKLIVSAVLTGSRTFTCFANGRRTCE